jgi:hypothetical protein
MYLLLGASTASAATVIFGDSSAPTKATGIQDLDVGGTLYNVTFNLQATAATIYGTYPGDFPIFNTASAASNARDAVNAALQAEGATAIGEDGLPGVDADGFNIAYDSFLLGSIESVNVARGFEETGEWLSGGTNQLSYNLDERAWAEFTEGGGGPSTSNARKVVEEGDTLPDGTLVTEIANVGGVAINISGQVAFHGRTGAEAAVFTLDGLVVKVGGTLPDGTLVAEIDNRGKVAINDRGEVAFHGRDQDPLSAVFTQNGLVAKQNNALPDGTTPTEISSVGGVAINNVSQVAFHQMT